MVFPLKISQIRSFTLFLSLGIALFLSLLSFPARAGDQADALSVVVEAVATIEDVLSDANLKATLATWLPRARAVLIVPNYYKGGFIIGGSYGNGILMARDNSGSFSPPAFYRLTGGSLGLQIGAQRAQMIYLVMTEQGLNAIINDQFKIGATIGISMAHIGANLEGSTTTSLTKDILALAVSQGAYGGATIEGATVTFRSDWNKAVYGAGANIRAILFDRRWTLPEATRVHNALNTAGAQEGASPAIPSPSSPTQSFQPAAPPGIIETQPLAPPASGTEQGDQPTLLIPSSGNTLY